MEKRTYVETFNDYMSTPISMRTAEMTEELIESYDEEDIDLETLVESIQALEDIMPHLANYMNDFIALKHPELPGPDGYLEKIFDEDYKAELELELKPSLEKFIMNKLVVAFQDELVPKDALRCIIHKNKEIKQENENLKYSLASTKTKIKALEDKISKIKEISNDTLNLGGKRDELKQLRKKVYEQNKELEELKQKLKKKTTSDSKQESQKDDIKTTNEPSSNFNGQNLKIGFVTAYPNRYEFEKLKSIFPKAFVISSTVNVLTSADLVVFLTMHTDHKLVTKYKNVCMSASIPYMYCGNSNPNKICEAIKKHECN